MGRFNRNKNERFDADDEAYERQAMAAEAEIKAQLTCPTGKKIIDSPSKAASTAKNMRRFKQDPFIDSYLCPTCGHYHVGHQRGTQQQRNALLKATA
jgi:hypothetical protein